MIGVQLLSAFSLRSRHGTDCSSWFCFLDTTEAAESIMYVQLHSFELELRPGKSFIWCKRFPIGLPGEVILNIRKMCKLSNEKHTSECKN